MQDNCSREFRDSVRDYSYFIGHPSLKWTLEDKRFAVSSCIQSVDDKPEISMDLLRILCREVDGCEELLSNHSFFKRIMQSAGYLDSKACMQESLKLLVNLLFQFKSCRDCFYELGGISSTITSLNGAIGHRDSDPIFHLKILFICSSQSASLITKCHELMICMIEMGHTNDIKKDILKIIFNIVSQCDHQFLTTLPQILVKEIMHDQLLHEYCLQILMNLNVSENWFIDIAEHDFIQKIYSNLSFYFDGIYQKNGRFPSSLTLHNQSFDHYITPYFWILNSMSRYKKSNLNLIKDLFLPKDGILNHDKMAMYLGILMTHAAYSEIRTSLSELIFTLFDEKSDGIVLYFGIGRASGLLASKGLLDHRLISLDRDTTSMLQEIPEEEECQKLICTIEKLEKNGLIQLKRTE